MSSFNLFSMAILLALVIVKGADLIADHLVNPQIQLAQNSYIVEGVDQPVTSAGGDDKPELEAVEPLLASASLEEGIKVAKKCLQCHSFEKGGKAKTGPNLWKIVDRKIGAVDDFAYSAAMKDYQGNWTYAKLNEYLHKPRNSIPGTKMSFAGLKKVEERAAIIAYLRTLSDTPSPLPEGKLAVAKTTPDSSDGTTGTDSDPSSSGVTGPDKDPNSNGQTSPVPARVSSLTPAA